MLYQRSIFQQPARVYPETFLRQLALSVFFVLVLFAMPSLAVAPQPKPDQLSLAQEQASHFAALALKCIRQEYPNKPDHTINDSSDVRNPRAMHAAFYGCLDWHSSVHGHWMLDSSLFIGRASGDSELCEARGYNGFAQSMI